MAVLPAGRPFCPGTASVGSGPGKLALLSSRRASRRAEGRPSAGLGRGRGPGSGVESAGLPHFRGGAGTGILWTPPAGGSENYGIRLPSSDAGKSSVENGTGEGRHIFSNWCNTYSSWNHPVQWQRDRMGNFSSLWKGSVTKFGEPSLPFGCPWR